MKLKDMKVDHIPKPVRIPDGFRLLVDTREQLPLFTKLPAVVTRKLDQGDYSIMGFEDRIKYLAQLIENFSLTGFIMHSNRSCKPYSVGMYRLQEEVSRLTGKPGVVIEADQNDPRVYSEAQVETRLEAFIESMTPVSA